MCGGGGGGGGGVCVCVCVCMLVCGVCVCVHARTLLWVSNIRVLYVQVLCKNVCYCRIQL